MSRRDFVVPNLLWASCSAARLRLRSWVFYFHLVWSATPEIQHILTLNPSLFRQWRGVRLVGRCNNKINWLIGCLVYSQTSKPNSSGRVLSRRMAMQALLRFRFQGINSRFVGNFFLLPRLRSGIALATHSKGIQNPYLPTMRPSIKLSKKERSTTTEKIPRIRSFFRFLRQNTPNVISFLKCCYFDIVIKSQTHP